MSVDAIVLGLGNPGEKYRSTRHNVGAAAVEALASRQDVRLKPSKDFAFEAKVRIGDTRTLLAVPTTFMNESGRAAGALWRRHPVEIERLIVVHDELDLEEGRIRVKRGGGLAGHNGLRSLAQHLKTQDFLRVRIGVGKPPGGKEQGAKHVLTPVTGPSREELLIAITHAADAVSDILTRGVDEAMREFNGRGAR